MLSLGAFALLYGGLCGLVIAPPPALAMGGLTVEAMLAGHLGDENQNLLGYHLRRTAANWALHGAMVLLFVLAMYGFYVPDDAMAVRFVLHGLLLGSTYATASGLAWFFDRGGLVHPLIARLKSHSPNNWRQLAMDINNEAMQPDALRVGIGGQKLVVTSHWLVWIDAHNVHLGHQREVRMRVNASRTATINVYLRGGFRTLVQVLSIDVVGLDGSSFTIRYPATEYQQLRERLQAEINDVNAVLIQQASDEAFVVAFHDTVNENTRHAVDSGAAPEPVAEPDDCVGCLGRPANVRITRRCAGPGVQTPCNECFCRPFFCVVCLGRWMASQQPQHRPDQWLMGRAPCPTCRRTFCALDVLWSDLQQRPEYDSYVPPASND